MTWIKLTLIGTDNVDTRAYINFDRIEMFARKENDVYTILTSSESEFHARETPDEIEAMLLQAMINAR